MSWKGAAALLIVTVASLSGLSPGAVHAESPPEIAKVPAVDLPDRDFEFRIGTVLIGMSLGVYVTDNLAIEAGFGFKQGIDKGYDLGITDVLPIAHASIGAEAGVMLGVAWEQTWKRSWLLDGDELSWRTGVRWRTHALFEASALFVAFRAVTADVNAGVGTTFPIYGGLTYTWWALPRRGRILGLLSKLTDIGLFVRVEAGPDVGSFTTYIDDVAQFDEYVKDGKVGAGKTAFPVIRAYYNFVFGFVI